MKVIYNKRHRDKEFEKEYGAKFADLDTLLKESDFISIHVPLTPETKHMISSNFVCYKLYCHWLIRI